MLKNSNYMTNIKEINCLKDIMKITVLVYLIIDKLKNKSYKMELIKEG